MYAGNQQWRYGYPDYNYPNYLYPPNSYTSSSYTPSPSDHTTPLKKEVHKLHQAVVKNNIEEILRLVNSGTNVNIVNDDHETALHYAARYKRTDAIQELINLGIDIEIKDQNNQTARDLLQQHPQIQSKFDNFVIEKHNYNIHTMNTMLYNILDLPSVLINIISEYHGSSGPLLKLPEDINTDTSSIWIAPSDDYSSKSEITLLGQIDSHSSEDAAIEKACPFCTIL